MKVITIIILILIIIASGFCVAYILLATEKERKELDKIQKEVNKKIDKRLKK